jgi:hypothetical protein
MIHSSYDKKKPNYIIRLNIIKISIQKTRCFFYILRHGKRTSNIWIRAIIEAIQAGTTVDKVYIQKEASSELMKDLMSDEACQCKLLLCSQTK